MHVHLSHNFTTQLLSKFVTIRFVLATIVRQILLPLYFFCFFQIDARLTFCVCVCKLRVCTLFELSVVSAASNTIIKKKIGDGRIIKIIIIIKSASRRRRLTSLIFAVPASSPTHPSPHAPPPNLSIFIDPSLLHLSLPHLNSSPTATAPFCEFLTSQWCHMIDRVYINSTGAVFSSEIRKPFYYYDAYNSLSATSASDSCFLLFTIKIVKLTKNRELEELISLYWGVISVFFSYLRCENSSYFLLSSIAFLKHISWIYLCKNNKKSSNISHLNRNSFLLTTTTLF